MATPRNKRALIVEDDPEMRNIYARLFANLRRDGFTAVVVEDGESALEILGREPVDIVVLDWILPGISGETVLRAIRAHPRTRSLGVLMVTGKCSPAEEILALDSGADDHLAKPFDERVLLARLKSLVRRRELESGRALDGQYPGLSFDPGADLVHVDGRTVHLTPKEAGLLHIFLHRPNVIRSHEFLWNTLWGYQADRWENLLIVTLSSLRRKLGDKWGACLICRKGEGYLFEYPPPSPPGRG